MMQLYNQNNIHSIIHLSEQLCSRVYDMDEIELTNKVSEYHREIEQYFQRRKQEDLTQAVQEELKQLLSIHEEMIEYFTNEKEKISKNIKQLHVGKKMQTSYS
ncbi:MAG: hypothetical protein HND53_00390 [Proteobacteria bacterium]|nr:hypothetical protein [Pseudomonadota bacterium]NOG58933.1 hypothetical protein [Pseudomonadota bacterium]